MGDTTTTVTPDRAALASARDQMRRDLNQRLGEGWGELTQRFEVAQTSYREADNTLETAKLRLKSATERRAESIAKAEELETEAYKLPADSADREEKLELAAKMRVLATAEDPIIAQTQQNVARLEPQVAERKALADEIDADGQRYMAQIRAAEEQLDRLDDKIRLIDREQAAAASAREAEADAEALEMEGDATAAAARRREAARFRVEAENAGRDAAAITIDEKPLADAGVAVPPGVEVGAAAADTSPTGTDATPATSTADPADGPPTNTTDGTDAPAEPSTRDDKDGNAAGDDAAPTARELSERADALTDQAARLRRELLDTTEAKFSELGVARDRAARERYGAEQQAASADIQVTRERREADQLTTAAVDEDAKAAAAEKRGDLRAAEELRENAENLRSASDVHSQRARQAQLDAAELREEAAQHARRVVELETEQQDVRDAGSEAAAELDKMEDQARLLEEASKKLADAATMRAESGSTPDDKTTGTINQLEDEAEKALEKVGDIEIDSGKITAVLPDAQIEAAAPVAPTDGMVGSADDIATSDDDIVALRMENIDSNLIDMGAAEPTDGIGDEPAAGDTVAVDDERSTEEPGADDWLRDDGAGGADTDWLREVIEDPSPAVVTGLGAEAASGFEHADFEQPAYDDFAEASASSGAAASDDVAAFDDFAE